MGPDVTHSIQDFFADLTDMTLADEDSKSIPTDDVNRAIQGNVAPLGGQICNWFKKCQLLAKSTANTSSVIWWPYWQPI